jgi:hypothetical protein
MSVIHIKIMAIVHDLAQHSYIWCIDLVNNKIVTIMSAHLF